MPPTRVVVESLPDLEEMTRALMKTTEEMHAILDDLARRAEIEPTTFDELSYLFYLHGVYVLAGALYSRMPMIFASSFYLQILVLCLLSGPDRFPKDVDKYCDR
jgi:hypothetical protein